MTKLQMAELHKLSVKDKMKVVQALWDDIAKEQSLEGISPTHKKILDDRLQKIAFGNAEFKPWAEVQSKYRNLK